MALNNGLDDSVIRMLPEGERRIPLPGWEQHAVAEVQSLTTR